MILFLIFAVILSLSVGWLLCMPVVAHAEIPRREKQKTAFCVLLATILFPFTLYWLVTF